MKIINGVIHYTVTEVSQLCGKTAQSINLWHKRSNELEAAGRERLIPAPHIEENGYKYWSEEDAKKIIEYASRSRKEVYGNMSKKREE